MLEARKEEEKRDKVFFMRFSTEFNSSTIFLSETNRKFEVKRALNGKNVLKRPTERKAN